MPPFHRSSRRLSALAAILVAPFVGTATPLPPPPAAEVRTPSADDTLVPLAARPLTLADIVARHGPPSQQVGADLWVYWHLVPPAVAARRGGYDTLIVHFEGETVRTAKYVRADALRALLRQLGQGRAHPAAVAGPATPG